STTSLFEGIHRPHRSVCESRAKYNEAVLFEIDPVCHMNVMPETAAGKYEYHGKTYYFCGLRCLERFRKHPEQFLTAGEVHDRPRSGALQRAVKAHPNSIYTCPMHPEVRQIGPGVCPKCGMALEPEVATLEEEKNPELTDMPRRFWIAA